MTNRDAAANTLEIAINGERVKTLTINPKQAPKEGEEVKVKSGEFDRYLEVKGRKPGQKAPAEPAQTGKKKAA